ncbi:hypothetical protein BX070DRAFT_232747 [Coemansia spiralis]|nr:hypothetical protein BX070DRAFT_232747 [Coemansia spiralis]
MAGILLESGVVLVPLACAAVYIVVTSNKLLTAISFAAAIVVLIVVRLRYHYSSGARSDVIVRSSSQASTPPITATASGKDESSKQAKYGKPKKNKSKKKVADLADRPAPIRQRSAGSDNEAGEFDEIVQDARNHCDIDDETIERCGSLLADTVTPESTKYDSELYGSALAFDHRCFYINGHPTWILAADFDYWRIPIHLPSLAQGQRNVIGASDDVVKDVWRRVLLQYKATGFNAVRIRFHWGFHSPTKEKYDFSANRNVGLLLTLCEDLGILVIACIGPYIGDDVQGGGFPFWLIQRDHIRLRHLWCSGLKIWDDRFAAAQAEWYDQIIPMLVGHEVVTKNARGHGCIVLLQLENHLNSRTSLNLPLALQDETRLLARMARERIIRVPLATNNLCWPNDFNSFGSKAWAAAEKKLRAYRIIKGPYYPDVSAFSVPDIDKTPVDIDGVARVTKGDNVPMVALELSGLRSAGGNKNLSDQIESALSQGLSAFSIPAFFKLANWGNIASTSLTANSGGNDETSAVGEDGVFPADSRSARLVLHIVRAFELQAASSDTVDSRPWISRTKHPKIRGVSIPMLPKDAVQVRRQWEHAPSADSTDLDCNDHEKTCLITYVDGRSLEDAKKELGFRFALADAPVSSKSGSFALTGSLGPRKRGIFVSNITVGEGKGDEKLLLVAASKEIYARISIDHGRAEVWVCAEESVQAGQLFFHGECQVAGHAEVEIVDIDHAKNQKFSFVIPKPGVGVANVTSQSGVSVHIVLVDQQALDTLVVGYGSYNRDSQMGLESGAHTAAAWGIDGMVINTGGNSVELPLSSLSEGKQGFVISQSRPKVTPETFDFAKNDGANSTFSSSPFIWQLSAISNADGDVDAVAHSEAQRNKMTTFSVQNLEQRITKWGSLPWKLLPTLSDLETMDQINIMSWQRDLGMFAYQATDVGFNASHVLYRCQVHLKPQHITSSQIRLQLNARHRCTVWINGHNMSGHETFHGSENTTSLKSSIIDALKHPGSAQGPDRWGGTVTYDVTQFMLLSEPDAEEGALNEIVIVVESYGMGTQAYGLNDARTPRGLIAAYWHGFNLIGEDHDDTEIHDQAHDSRTEQLKTRWEICGVDVTQMPQPFNSSGFPDELEQDGWVRALEKPLVHNGWSTRVNVDVDAGVQWWRWQISASNAASKFRDEPMYLRIVGRATAFVWVNGVLLAKHRADAEESRVLLWGGLLGSSKSALLPPTLTSEVVVMMYGWAKDADISSGIIAKDKMSNRNISVELLLTSSR